MPRANSTATSKESKMTSSLEKCESDLAQAEAKLRNEEEAEEECSKALSERKDTLHKMEMQASAKHDVTKQALIDLRKTVVDEKESRRLALNAIHDRHDEQKACSGRLLLVKESQNSGLTQLLHRIQLAENKLKTKQAEMAERLREKLIAKQKRVTAVVESEEKQARDTEVEAEEAVEEQEEQLLDEADFTIDQSNDDGAEHVKVVVSEALAQDQEKLESIKSDREEQVLGKMQELMDLRAQITQLTMRLNKAKEYTTLDTTKRAEAEKKEKKYRDWYNGHGINLKTAQQTLNTARETAMTGLQNKKKIANNMLHAVDPEYEENDDNGGAQIAAPQAGHIEENVEEEEREKPAKKR